jgi:hypothetical protein
VPAGYSLTPLIKKLGIKPGMKILLINEPGNYFQLLETNINDQLITGAQVADIVHLFAASKKEFVQQMKALKLQIKQNPKLVIWVSWYKKSSGIKTELTEDIIRNYALQSDLVDVKVCAVSEIWSGLKLVVPLNKRK